MESFSFDLRDNVSYFRAKELLDSSDAGGRYQSASKLSESKGEENAVAELCGRVSPNVEMSEVSPAHKSHQPHYQLHDPFSPYKNVMAIENLSIDDIALENLPNLALMDPNRLQLILLVKMQKMLLEMQTEKQSMHSAAPLVQSDKPKPFKEVPDLKQDDLMSEELGMQEAFDSTTQTRSPQDLKPWDKPIMYSTLSFSDYEIPKESLITETKSEQDMKLVLGKFNTRLKLPTLTKTLALPLLKTLYHLCMNHRL